MSVVSYIYPDTQEQVKYRKSVISDHPSVFAEIYQEDVNITIWQRDLSVEVDNCVQTLLGTNGNYDKTLIVKPDNAYVELIEADNKLQNAQALCQDIAELVDMFCLLYELKQVGLRLVTLDRAMCPRFHVDRVPSRLVCTYHGVASEWLSHDKVDRSKLGKGNNGLVDEKSGLYQCEQDINRLKIGDVAMFKGELWHGNENAGLVHRSPQVSVGQKRLLLTLDFVD